MVVRSSTGMIPYSRGPLSRDWAPYPSTVPNSGVGKLGRCRHLPVSSLGLVVTFCTALICDFTSTNNSQKNEKPSLTIHYFTHFELKKKRVCCQIKPHPTLLYLKELLLIYIRIVPTQLKARRQIS